MKQPQPPMVEDPGAPVAAGARAGDLPGPAGGDRPAEGPAPGVAAGCPWARVTGASRGIGRAVAEGLVAGGHNLVLALRQPADAPAVRALCDALRRRRPGVALRLLRLDLADLGQVRAAAAALCADGPPLSLVVANAGVFSRRERAPTTDGFERHMGVNHLGHFALVVGLQPLLRPAARVVVVTSVVHHLGALPWGALGERGGPALSAYAASKLANQMFALALDRRLAPRGGRAVGVHPGFVHTGMLDGLGGVLPGLPALVARLAQRPEQGAAHVLHAALEVDELAASGMGGPQGWLELWGAPGPRACAPAAMDEADQERLWALSERATGQRWREEDAG